VSRILKISENSFFLSKILRFLEYGKKSILFQREINSADPFVSEQQHGLTILMSEEEIKDYFEKYSWAI